MKKVGKTRPDQKFNPPLPIFFRIAEQVLTYNQANRAVAILCNHRKTASKNFDDQMGRMDEKLNKKRQDIEDKEAQLDCASKKVSRINFNFA